jgi:hypothetical protein
MPRQLSPETDRETRVVRSVRSLNFSVDKLAFEFFDAVTKAGFELQPRVLQSLSLPTTNENSSFIIFFLSANLRKDQRMIVAEAILRDMIYSVIFDHYFDGDIFMGVRTTSERNFWENMYKTLRTCGKRLKPFFFFFFFL